jgi:rhodanese-related sulfurtransferase
MQTLLAPGHDYDNRIASNLATECRAQPLLAGVLQDRLDAAAFAAAKAELECGLGMTQYQTLACGARVEEPVAETASTRQLDPAGLQALLQGHPDLLLVDVREPYEQRLSPSPELAASARREAVPMSSLLNGLPRWLALPPATPVVFFCRSGNRSAQAAQVLRRLGHAQAWSLVGGRALWPQAARREAAALDAAFNI